MGRKEDIGDRIRVMRKSRGYTQRELARLVGAKGSSTVGMWETGKRAPDPETLEALADIFNVPMSAFFDDPETIVVHFPEDNAPKTVEARILAAGIDQMPERDREKALNVIRMLFEQYAPLFEQKGNEDDDT